jgi:hypothetical protein
MEFPLWVLGNVPCSDFIKMFLQLVFRPKSLIACAKELEILVTRDGSGQPFCFSFDARLDQDVYFHLAMTGVICDIEEVLPGERVIPTFRALCGTL